ncbi:hypothetical protein [Endozoicomonas sp. YOMI1]|uniref:hypothetical protein n=1 Tax=Endozoicomonas sp. YOMI1 TaxID=2828739 RepID=UPI0021489BB4|nr:hypothetical protein [Endozoicomonas sp. YOMI1]
MLIRAVLFNSFTGLKALLEAAGFHTSGDQVADLAGHKRERRTEAAPFRTE